MKKKNIAFLIFILISCFTLFADSPVATPFQLRGHVFGNTVFSVSILEEVLPFNLEDTDVGENLNPYSVLRGLRIGTYSLESNVTSFKLYIAHDPLVLTNRSFGTEGDTGTLSKIDYRLYMETGGSSFKSCLSDHNLGITVSDAKTATIKMVLSGTDAADWPEGTTLYSNKGLYVSLEDYTSGTTVQTVSDLMAGTYSSTIYFLLEGGQ